MSTRARHLLKTALGGTPYLERAVELLEAAERHDTDECCSVWAERSGEVAAIVLVGLVAGSMGAGRVHLVIGEDPHLVARALDVLRGLGARFAMAEWPDDAPFTDAARRLRESGFVEEARIPDYYRPGVDQVILRHDL